MSDPKRLVDDAKAPAELRELLLRAAPRRRMDAGARARGRSRVGKVSGASVTLAAWLGWKTALAAVGIAAGTATAVVVKRLEAPEAPPAPVPALTAPEPRGRTPAPEAPPAPIEGPALVPSPELPSSAAPSPPTGRMPALEQDLAEESRLLEAARRLLGAAPSEALSLARQHRKNFTRPALGVERSLIEVDALARLGRTAEARKLAESLLRTGPGGLYEARIRGLLEKMNGAAVPLKETEAPGD